jgi:hypothetical protein
MTKPRSSFTILDDGVQDYALYNTPNYRPRRSLKLTDSVLDLRAQGFDDVSRALRCMLE